MPIQKIFIFQNHSFLAIPFYHGYTKKSIFFKIMFFWNRSKQIIHPLVFSNRIRYTPKSRRIAPYRYKRQNQYNFITTPENTIQAEIRRNRKHDGIRTSGRNPGRNQAAIPEKSNFEKSRKFGIGESEKINFEK